MRRQSSPDTDHIISATELAGPKARRFRLLGSRSWIDRDLLRVFNRYFDCDVFLLFVRALPFAYAFSRAHANSSRGSR